MAYDRLAAQKNIDLMSSVGVFTNEEMAAQHSILHNAFSTQIDIEVRTALKMLNTLYIPAVFADLKESQAAKELGIKMSPKKAELAQELVTLTEALAEKHAASPSDDDSA